MSKDSRIDITNKVTIKIDGSRYLCVYLDNICIGMITLENGGESFNEDCADDSFTEKYPNKEIYFDYDESSGLKILLMSEKEKEALCKIRKIMLDNKLNINDITGDYFYE